MNENVNMNLDEAAANIPAGNEPDAPQPMMIDLPTAVNTVIARTEATSIVVAVINAFLTILQQRDSAVFTAEELTRIQETVNLETGKTDALYAEIEKALAANSTPVSHEPETQEL